MPEVDGGRVVQPGEARSIDIGGFDVIVLADTADTDRVFSLIETREDAAGMVPVGMTHTFSSMTPGSRKLNLYTPAAMIGYFDELAAGIKAGMDEQEIDAIAERYAMEVVGPVPEGYL